MMIVGWEVRNNPKTTFLPLDDQNNIRQVFGLLRNIVSLSFTQILSHLFILSVFIVPCFMSFPQAERKKKGGKKLRERESVVNDERKLQHGKSSSSIWFRRVDDDGFVRCIIMSSKGEREREKESWGKTFTSEPGRRGEED